MFARAERIVYYATVGLTVYPAALDSSTAICNVDKLLYGVCIPFHSGVYIV